MVSLANRVEIVGDAYLDSIYPEKYPGWIEVHTADVVVREHRDNPSGAHDSPNFQAGLLAKFEALHGRKGDAMKALVLDGATATPVNEIVASMV